MKKTYDIYKTHLAIDYVREFKNEADDMIRDAERKMDMPYPRFKPGTEHWGEDVIAHIGVQVRKMREGDRAREKFADIYDRIQSDYMRRGASSEASRLNYNVVEELLDDLLDLADELGV